MVCMCRIDAICLRRLLHIPLTYDNYHLYYSCSFLSNMQSTLLKIMAGVEKEFDGTARPLPGSSIGYLPQEPRLEYETVKECIDSAVASSRAILDKYNELSLSMADPNLTDEEMTSAMNQLEAIGDKIEAENLWELDRMVER